MARPDARSLATREVILATAERLFAENGIFTVSNRQISEAAGQGNNAAVGYHFGSRDSLLTEIVKRHNEPIEKLRGRQVDAVDSDDLRTWIDCMVRPTADHLDQLGPPTWYARFTAQIMADPSTRELLAGELSTSPTIRLVSDNLHRCRPELPDAVLAERQDITRNVILQTCADRERALATGGSTPRRTWSAAATGLVDALVGLWTAPVTEPAAARPRSRTGRRTQQP